MHQRLGGSSKLRVENRVTNLLTNLIVATLSLSLLVLTAAPTVHAQALNGRIHTDKQDGALVVANPDYNPDFAVAIWAENWSADPPYESRLFSSYSEDAGLTWTPRQMFLSHPRGIYATALPNSFSGWAADAFMDDDGVVHVVFVFGIWGGIDLAGDTWSEVRYGKLDYTNGVLYDQYLLAEGPMGQQNPGHSQVAMCLGREVPGGEGSRYIHVLFGYDPSNEFDDGQMLYTRSTDWGETWSTPLDINMFDGLDAPSPCDITADENGYVYLAYGPSWYSP